MLTFLKRLASMVPTPNAGKVTVFVDDAGMPSFKDDAGDVTPMVQHDLPAGGTAGQVPIKSSGDDYDVEWGMPTANDVGAVPESAVGVSVAGLVNGKVPIAQLPQLTKGHIDGLRMRWVSPSEVELSSGAAYVPGAGRIAELAEPVSLRPALAANTWYHVYILVDGATTRAEAVVTVPAAPYSGTARAKTGDTSRRYVGSFRTMPGAAAIAKFDHVLAAGAINYLEASNASPLQLAGGINISTPTTISAAAVVPITGREVKVSVLNTSTTAYILLSNSQGPSLSGGGYLTVAAPGGVTVTPIALDAAQAYTCVFDAAPGSGGLTYQRAFGYTYER